MAIIYIRGPNPIWFFNNLTGAPLNDTYYAFFLTNDLPYVPQAVYQDPNGINPWSDPIEFQPSGGLPNNLYFNPDETYRIEIRQGPTQTSPLIWLVQNYTAGEGSGGGVIITDPLTVAANLIVDPNFSDVFFNGTYTYTNGTPGTYTLMVGPGWQLVLVGSGTTVLTQGLIAGTSDTVGNPPYYLGISNSGWTSATLVQNLPNNGAIFAGGAVAIALTAQAVSSAQNLTVNYVPNGPANSQTIFAGSIATGGFQAYYGALGTPGNLMNASLNTNTGMNANVQIQFVLPPNGNLQLTNIQVVGQSNPTSANFVAPSGTNPGSVPLYQELTYPQIVNGEFNVYRDSIINHPKSTFLVGWEFALNPWQFTSKTPANVAANQYTADQTIVIQQDYVSAAGGNNISVGQAPEINNLGFIATAVTAHNQFGILQYIPASTNTPYFGQVVSSMVRAQLISTHSPVTTVKIKLRLIYLNNSPLSVSQNYPVASWTEGGDPVFAGSITAIIPENDPVYTLTNNVQNFPFNNMMIPALVNTPQTLGIFVYTVGDMNQASTADSVVFNDVSLIQNRFAMPSNPKTADQVLRECQYFYEKSYEQGTLPGAGTSLAPVYNGAVFNNGTIYQNGSNTFMYFNDLYIQFRQQKNKVPTMTIYSVDGTSGAVYASIRSGNSFPTPMSGSNPSSQNISNWTASPILSTATAYYYSVTATGIYELSTTVASATAEFNFHYTADARLGL